MSATVVTFYSYKGGVGRTQALANMALWLASSGKRVIVVDMDLESPGLHVFFPPPLGSRVSWTGVLEFLEESYGQPSEPPDVLGRLQPCLPNLPDHGVGSIRVLRAGDLTADYSHRLSRFNWEEYYRDRGGYRSIEYLRDTLVHSDADFVLVDSRTGATDVGAVCTFQLPDVLLVFFALHEQGIQGAEQVVRAVAARRAEPPGRLRRLVAVPSRVDETGEDALRELWLSRVRNRFGGFVDELLVEPNRRIPHMARASFGEYLSDPSASDGNILQLAYANLARMLAGGAQLPAVPNAADLLAECDSALADVDDALARIAGGGTPLDEVVGHVARVEARATLLNRHALLLRDQITRVGAMLGRAWTPPDLLVAGTRDVWRERLRVLREGMEGLRDAAPLALERARAVFGPGELPERPLALALEALRAGDLGAFAIRWPDALDALRRQSPLVALATRDVTLEELRDWFPGDAPGSWIELLLQNAVESRRGTKSTAGADRTLFNLLRLALRVDDLTPTLLWAAYTLSLDGEPPPLDRELFDEVGATLWARSWLGVLDAVETLTEDAFLEEPRVLEQMRRFDHDECAALRASTDAVAGGLLRAWGRDGGARVRAVFRRYAMHPYLLRAVDGVDASAPHASPIVAALLDAQRTAGWAWASKPVERLAMHLAGEGRVAEAFYLLCAEGQRQPRLVEGDLFVEVAVGVMLEACANQCADTAEELLLHDEFVRAISRTEVGAAWLAWLATGFDQRSWSHEALAVVRRQLGAAATAARLPTPVRDFLATRPPEALISPRDAIRWFETTGATREKIRTVSVHKSLGMAPKYEAAFRSYWRSRIAPLADVAHKKDIDAEMLDQATTDDVITLARRDNRGIDDIVGSARRSLENQFEEVRALARELQAIVLTLPMEARPFLEHRARDAIATRDAFVPWVEAAQRSSPPWLAGALLRATTRSTA